MEEIRGKTALVTGASKRIGCEISLELARAGINVVIHYNRSEVDAKNLCDRLISLGVKAWPLKADFDVSSEYEELIDHAFDLSGSLNFLINSASIFPVEDLKKLSFEEVMTNMKINTWAPFVLCQKFSERAKEGKIINLLDTRIGSLDWSHIGYTLSKQALTTLTKMIALKYAPNITVNAIAPGLILPPPGLPQSYLENKINSVPLKRHGEPHDVAQVVMFLLNTTFITGNIIYVDGGQHLGE